MKRKHARLLIFLTIMTFVMAFVCLFVGSSHIGPLTCAKALFGYGDAANIRIIQKIRLPRVLAALAAGAGLSVSGLVMQTVLCNPMASPSTLGVSNAAVFGANLSILFFWDGALHTGKTLSSYTAFISGMNPYAAGLSAFVFSMISIILILSICRLRSFTPGTVVLTGIAVGSVWNAASAILQYYATDAGISSSVIWSFGDLGRATFQTVLIMAAVTAAALIFFSSFAWHYNALLSGADTAAGLGIRVGTLRFVSLLLCSLVASVCVSSLGIIGFVGIICPHIAKKLFNQNHCVTLPASALIGALLLLCADTLSRCIGNGSSLPVGAITTLLGAPFFLILIFGKRRNHNES